VVSTNPEQMAAAYGTFAAHGQQMAPYTVTSVQQGGKTVYQHQGAAKQAFTPLVADQVTQALQGVVANGSGGGAQLADGRDVAGKTGTTDLPGDGAKLGSVWFVGYTPTLSTAVAVWGQTEGGALEPINGLGGKDTVGGGAVAAPLWAAYMNKAVAGTPAQPFTFTAQNNQAAPMNPVTSSQSSGPGSTGSSSGPSSTKQPTPPSPTGTFQPPQSGPSNPTGTGGGGTISNSTNGPSTSASTSQPPSSTSKPSLPSGPPSSTGGAPVTP
jgi:membrane peptidoglycan carboxypeptidase